LASEASSQVAASPGCGHCNPQQNNTCDEAETWVHFHHVLACECSYLCSRFVDKAHQGAMVVLSLFERSLHATGGNSSNMGRGSTSVSQGPLRSAGGQSGGVLTAAAGMQNRLADLRALYKGVFGAATGAGIIIGTYFAFYSTTKNALRRHTDLHEGTRLCL